MKKKLLSIFAIAAIAVAGYSQALYGDISVSMGTDVITGVEFYFDDASITDVGLKGINVQTSPVVDVTAANGDGALSITLSDTTGATKVAEWWNWAINFQYIHYDSNSEPVAFDFSNAARASFTIETDVELGYNFKLDSFTYSPTFKALEQKDTITMLNTPVTINVDLAKIASNAGVSLSSKDYSAMYLYFWPLDMTKHDVTLYALTLGDKTPLPSAINEVITDESFIHALYSPTVESIEVINVLGQVTDIVKTVDELNVEGVAIVKVIMEDGSEIVGKIGK